MSPKKIIVVGAGAAGVMAAGTAAELGASVLLLEKMKAPLSKLKITGKGRCNITNIADREELLKAYSSALHFMKPSIYSFSNTDLIEFFENLGVKTKIERGGRVFPEDDSAPALAAALYKWIKKWKVDVKNNVRVHSLNIANERFVGVKDFQGRSYVGDAVILATGGASYPLTGSSGDGYVIAKKAGHKIIQIRPALVPLETSGDIAKKLQGLSLKNIEISAWVNLKKVQSVSGEMLFTHFGVSGPAVLTLSKTVVKALEAKQKVEISIDFKPALSQEQLDIRLRREFSEHKKMCLKNMLKFLLPSKIHQVFIECAGLDPDKQLSYISSSERKKLRLLLKDFRLVVSRSRPIEEAIVTSGGVSIKEINRKDMSSRLITDLYFAGEVVDVDAKTGGYNLQAAFSTGRLAGISAVSTWKGTACL